jgi:hypothetical protein
MPETSPALRFTLPPRISVPVSFDPIANQKRLMIIISDAFRESRPSIEQALEKLDGSFKERIVTEAQAAGHDPENFLYGHFKHICMAYAGYRTGLAEARNPETGDDVTKTALSTELTFLAYLIGDKLAAECYRTITADIDDVLETRYGQQR